MILSYFKIEILAIQDEFVLLGHKGLIKILTYKETRIRTKVISNMPECTVEPLGS